MNRLRLTLLSLGLVLLSALVSFAAFTAFYERPAQGSVSSTEDEVRVVQVASAEEASRLAGYRVVGPALLPEGFSLHRVWVVRKPDFGPGEHRLPPDVTLMWRHRDVPGLFIHLTQDPTLRGLGGGETAAVAGVQGQLAGGAPAVDGGHSYLSFFWRKGEMGFLLTGTLEGPVTKEALLAIADSVPTP